MHHHAIVGLSGHYPEVDEVSDDPERDLPDMIRGIEESGDGRSIEYATVDDCCELACLAEREL